MSQGVVTSWGRTKAGRRVRALMQTSVRIYECRYTSVSGCVRRGKLWSVCLGGGAS